MTLLKYGDISVGEKGFILRKKTRCFKNSLNICKIF